MNFNPEKHIPKINESFDINKQIEAKEEMQNVKELFFRDKVETSILESYEQIMRQAGFSEEQIQEFEEQLQNPEIHPVKVLAWPWELRKRMIPTFLKSINEGKETIASMVKKVHDFGQKFGRSYAFHCSAHDIPKHIGKPGKDDEWYVAGTEKDHRDDDLPMAYYSFDYLHLYREKNPKYLYLVSINNQGSHRTDGASWGRASTLPIIDKLELREVDKEVEHRYQEYKKEKAMASNDAA